MISRYFGRFTAAALAAVVMSAITVAAKAAEKRVVEIRPEIVAPERILNGSFEGAFREGVAEGWTPIHIRPGGRFKENAKLGPIGGGVYGARNRSVTSDGWNEDAMTIRLAGKVHLVDVAREDVVKQLREALGDDVITVLKYGPEDFFRERKQDPLASPAVAGRIFADYCRERSEKSGIKAHAYYGLNEPNVNSREDFAKIAAFEKAFTLRLHQHGMRSVVINHSTGTPGDRRNMLEEPVRDLLAVADYVGYHCYGGPKDELMCAVSSNPNSMRWRTFARWYQERGWRFPPMIYTEATTWGGWHDQFSPELIRDDILCMAGRMADEPWSIGMCLFCTGCWPGQVWCKWDMSVFPEIIEELRTYNLAHPVDARTGTKSQQIAASGRPFAAALSRSFASRPGSNMHVQAWIKYEFYDGWPHRLKIRAGIDNSGQTRDAKAPTITWSDELIETGRWDSDIWYRWSEDFGPVAETSSVWFHVEQAAGPAVRVSIDDVSAVETP
ncbi:MAG: hypothetical protein AMXMBFR13_50290 [Phycisphaerae bacterium]